MAYIRVNWEDLPSTNTTINATNLNKMDAGIKENDERLNGTKPMGSIVVDDVNCKNMYGPVMTGIIMNNSGVETANSDWQSTPYIEVNSSNNYYYSYSTNNPQSVMGLVTEYNSSKAFIKQTVINADTHTIQTTSTTKYVRLSNRVDINMTNIQFELGSTATNYVEYKEPVKITNIGVKEDTTFYANDFKCRNIANLIDFTQTANQSSTYKDIGIVYLEAGTYTLSWTQSASMTSNSRNTPGYTGAATAWQTQNTNANMSAGRSSWTFIIDNAGIYTFRWWINTPSTTVNMTDFMLEKGNEVTSYTPFKSFGEEIYSTNEMVIGTWIDGKPIYRKVIYTNLGSTKDVENTIITLDTNSTIIDFEAKLIAYDRIYYLPFSYNNEDILLNSYNNLIKEQHNYVGANGLDCRINVLYTKTTD